MERDDDDGAVMGADCPLCYGPPTYLGPLGTHRWFRCRDCGATYGRAQRVSEEEDATDTIAHPTEYTTNWQ